MVKNYGGPKKFPGGRGERQQDADTHQRLGQSPWGRWRRKDRLKVRSRRSPADSMAVAHSLGKEGAGWPGTRSWWACEHPGLGRPRFWLGIRGEKISQTVPRTAGRGFRSAGMVRKVRAPTVHTTCRTSGLWGQGRFSRTSQTGMP